MTVVCCVYVRVYYTHISHSFNCYHCNRFDTGCYQDLFKNVIYHHLCADLIKDPQNLRATILH